MTMKSFIRDTLADVLLATGLSRPERACRGKLLILTLHRVLPAELRSEYPQPGLVITPDELRWLLAEVVPHFEVDTVSEALRRLRAGAEGRPLLAISFDDGQWDNLEFAAPILRQFDVRATFYLPTDFIETSRLLWHDEAGFAWRACGRPGIDRAAVAATIRNVAIEPGASVGQFLERLKAASPQMRADAVKALYALAQFTPPDWARLMTWDEVRRLRDLGHEIGSHSCSHALFPQLDAAAQLRELTESKRVIASALDVPVRSFCYPNGSYDEKSLVLAAEAGYENAVTTSWGVNAADRSVYELLRCDMDARRLVDRRGTLSRARLAMRLSGMQPGLAV
jgi:peptidoglycan/xylan/chitin deacetylase (PgdA/CDA1 family)